MSRTGHFLVSVALVAMGLGLLSSAGCRKKEEAPAVDPSSPQSYMSDKPFLNKLAEQKRSRQEVWKRHLAVRRAYEEALRGDPRGEKPETQDLKKRLDALEDEHRALRRETARTVRERLRPKKAN